MVKRFIINSFASLGLVFFICLVGCQGLSKNSEFQDDFRILHEQMLCGYANLNYQTQFRGINLENLYENHLRRLSSAKSQSEARHIIENYLAAFQDGHLVIVEQAASELSDGPVLLHTDDAEQALSKLNFFKGETTFRIRYDSIIGFQELTFEENPFPTIILDSFKIKIGIVRIEFFTIEWYSEIAQIIWKDHQNSFEGACKTDCQEELFLKIETELLYKLIEVITSLKSNGVDAIAIDISGNGGGTEWAYVVARLFTKQNLVGNPYYFVRHPHWKEIFRNDLELIESDLFNPYLNCDLRSELSVLRELAKIEYDLLPSDCTKRLDGGKKVKSKNYVRHPYLPNFPEAITENNDFKNSKSKEILNTSRFIPYEFGYYEGPLYVIQDRYTASAAEGFASLLQSNLVAKIVGERSYGVGCGYTNGGIEVHLASMDIAVRIPDCIRETRLGQNEIEGIVPDINIDLEGKTSFEKGKLIHQKITKDLIKEEK